MLGIAEAAYHALTLFLVDERLRGVVHHTCQVNVLVEAHTTSHIEQAWASADMTACAHNPRTFCDRPPQSWVDSVTSTRLYTLNHSG